MVILCNQSIKKKKKNKAMTFLALKINYLTEGSKVNHVVFLLVEPVRIIHYYSLKPH